MKCAGRSLGLMYRSHVGCMIVERGVEFLGNFLCFLLAGRMRVALRDSIIVRRNSFVPVLSPLGSLAMMTLMGCHGECSSRLCGVVMLRVYSSIECQVIKRETRCLRSLWEYCIVFFS